MTLDFLAAVRRIDAAVIYEFLLTVCLEGMPGTLHNVTLEAIAERLNGYGLRTGRDGAFTAAVVRKNLARLEDLGAVTKQPLQGASFDLTIHSRNAGGKQRQTAMRAASQNDFQNENQNENQLQNSTSESAQSTSYTRVNILINKQIKQNFSVSEKEPDQPQQQEQRKTIDALADDFAAKTESADAQRLRAKLARDIYEPGIHAQLIDRAVLAVAAGIATCKELKAAVNAAKENLRLYKVTNGFKGAATLWRSFALSVKSWYDAAGFAWTATDWRREPQPKPLFDLAAIERRLEGAAA